MITGSIVALVTPMHNNGEIDWQALARLIEFHIESGTNAIVAVGTTGESATLSVDEHIKVIEYTVKLVKGRLAVIAGTGGNSTSESIHLTQEAKNAGVNACLLVTPYYNKPTQFGLIKHYEAIANAVDIPQILYNVPGRTACDLLPETVLELVHHRNIVGIKEATGDLARAKFLIDNCPSDFAIYSGDDATACDLILMGGKGNVSVTANIAPKQMSEICALALQKDNQATMMQNFLMPLHKAMFVESNPIPVKWAMHKMGLIENCIRLPLTILSDSKQTMVLSALSQCKLI